MFSDGWDRLLNSLDVLKKKKNETRTVIRITVVKNLTDVYPEQYAPLIKSANPLFVEVKSYSWMGASKDRLQRENVMDIDEVRFFASEITFNCGYQIVDEQDSGRVILLMEQDVSNRIMEFH